MVNGEYEIFLSNQDETKASCLWLRWLVKKIKVNNNDNINRKIKKKLIGLEKHG